MRSETDIARAPRRLKELYSVKRLALQDLGTVAGALGHLIDEYQYTALHSFVVGANLLLGSWNSPFPTPLQLLSQSSRYREAIEVDTVPVVKEAFAHLAALLHTLAITSDPRDAASKLYSQHSAFLAAVGELAEDKAWATAFRCSRDQVVRKIMNEFLPLKVDKAGKSRYERPRGQGVGDGKQRPGAASAAARARNRYRPWSGSQPDTD